MKNPNNPADAQYVVIQNGQRVTPATAVKQEAKQEADRRNKLAEGSGKPANEHRATVAQNIFG